MDNLFSIDLVPQALDAGILHSFDGTILFDTAAMAWKQLLT